MYCIKFEVFVKSILHFWIKFVIINFVIVMEGHHCLSDTAGQAVYAQNLGDDKGKALQ